MKKNVLRRFDSAAVKKTPKTTTLRLESLESRDLLSVAPGGEPLAVDAANICGYMSAATNDVDVLDLSAVVLDDAAPATPECLTVAPSESANPTPLATPVLTVSGKSDTSITVSWNAVPNAERYSFSYKPSGETTWKNVNVGTNLSYTVAGLTADTNYDLRLKAIGDGVNYKSVYSSIVSAKTDAPVLGATANPTPLATPVLTVSGATETSVTVSWGAVAHADRYSLSYKLSSDSTWTNVNAGTNTSYTVSGLTTNASYDFRLKAIGDGVNYKSVYSAIVSATPSDGPVSLAKPVLSISGKTSTTITVAWNAVPNALRYSLSYKLSSDSSWSTNVNVGTNTSYTVSSLTPNTSYDFRLKAIGDGVSYKSVYSDVVNAKTNASDGPEPLPTPALTVSDATSTSITVSWNAVPNALRYSLSYKLASVSTWTNVNVGTNTSYTINELESNAEYDLRLKAVGDGVNYKSVYSPIVRAETRPSLIQETPSTVVTTNWDVVDAYDGKISLREALEYAEPGDTIAFSKLLKGRTIWLNSNLGALTPSKSLTIDASNLRLATNLPGLTIDALGVSRVLALGTGDVEIDGIAFTNGYAAERGGAIYNNGATLTLKNCAIRDSHAHHGGGLCVLSGETTLVNCTVTNNTAEATDEGESYGGGIYNNGATLSLDNCVISDNEAWWGGGVCSFNGETTLVNCDVMNNSAALWDSCIALSDSFGSDYAYEHGFRGYGGGVCSYQSVTSLVNCDILNNIVEVSYYYDVENGDGYFEGGTGAGVYSYESETTLTDCTVASNIASNEGGGVYNDNGTLFLGGCFIVGNWSDGGAGVISDGGETTLVDCAITGNYADGGAGGVYSYDSETTLVNCTITENSGNTGGIRVAGASVLTATNCLVARNDAEYGGALQLRGGSATLYSCTIADNEAFDDGGGVEVFNPHASVVFNAYNTIFAGNHVWNPDHNVYYSDDVFVCATDPSYAGYYETFGDVVVNAYNTLSSYTDWTSGANNLVYNASKPLFTNAAAGDYTLASVSQALDKGNNQYATVDDIAGRIRIVGGRVDLGAYEYRSSSEREPRSTVVTTNLDVVDAYDGKISLREAMNYADSGATITFADSLKGRTIALDPDRGSLGNGKSLTIDASNLYDADTQTPGLTISGQNATRILYLYEGDVEINGITFANGYAKPFYYSDYSEGRGGAIFNRGATLSLNNCVIRDNKAEYDGGGVFCGREYDDTNETTSITTFTNCVVSNNTAYVGGGVCSDSEETTFIKCSITNNTAIGGEKGGGGVCSLEGNTTLVDCLVVGNTAAPQEDVPIEYGWSQGGGLVFGGETATLYNCTIFGNTACHGGGVYLDAESYDVDFTAYNSIIAGNSALNALYASDEIFSEPYTYYSQTYYPVAKAYNTLSSYTDWDGGANNLVYNASKPLFTNAAAGDYTLAANSQALNKGNNQYVQTSADLAGNARISGGTVDLGAYEYQSAANPVALDAPVLTIAGMTGRTITVAWDAVAHAERYSLSYKLASSSTWTNVNVGTSTSYTITGLDRSSNYDLRLKAIGDGVNYKSVYSATVRVKTTSASSAVVDFSDELFDELAEEDYDLLAENFVA